jgi:hypothetical protein
MGRRTNAQILLDREKGDNPLDDAWRRKQKKEKLKVVEPLKVLEPLVDEPVKVVEPQIKKPVIKPARRKVIVETETNRSVFVEQGNIKEMIKNNLFYDLPNDLRQMIETKAKELTYPELMDNLNDDYNNLIARLENELEDLGIKKKSPEKIETMKNLYKEYNNNFFVNPLGEEKDEYFISKYGNEWYNNPEAKKDKYFYFLNNKFFETSRKKIERLFERLGVDDYKYNAAGTKFIKKTEAELRRQQYSKYSREDKSMGGLY